jgi:hypothetical protein
MYDWHWQKKIVFLPMVLFASRLLDIIKARIRAKVGWQVCHKGLAEGWQWSFPWQSLPIFSPDVDWQIFGRA